LLALSAFVIALLRAQARFVRTRRILGGLVWLAYVGCLGAVCLPNYAVGDAIRAMIMPICFGTPPFVANLRSVLQSPVKVERFEATIAGVHLIAALASGAVMRAGWRAPSVTLSFIPIEIPPLSDGVYYGIALVCSALATIVVPMRRAERKEFLERVSAGDVAGFHIETRGNARVLVVRIL
jgi:hypothetical protein